MDMIDLEKYKSVEIIYPADNSYDDIIGYLQKIVMDRSIPEENKVDVNKQLNEIMRLKYLNSKPPIIILKPKD